MCWKQKRRKRGLEEKVPEAEAAKKTAEAEKVITGADSPKAEGKEGNASSQN